jgi:starch phosphorylase
MSENERKRIGRRDSDAVRTGLGVEAIKRDLLDNLFYIRGRFAAVATTNDYYLALAYTVRDRLLHRWVSTSSTYHRQQVRTVAYLSAEYLPGPHLGNNMLNLGITEKVRQATAELGLDLDELIDKEEEPGLGNGGLGRLAACFMDSLATLEMPAIGYGLRYEFGIFDQEIKDGWQVEVTDKWLRFGNPWEVPHPEISFQVNFGGCSELVMDDTGRYRARWAPDYVVKGVAYDTPILGYRVNTANLMRLWKAEACESFDFDSFNVGDYYGAVEEKVQSENISKVLYPNDEPAQGKRLRLKQQYFFVSCSLQDMIRIYLQTGENLESFHEKFAVQLNDTHPSLAVAELMRLLLDSHGLDWDTAWDITSKTFGYTNHTLLPEALEKWPLKMFAELLPRILDIILEINRRFLEDVRNRFPGDEALIERISLIDESGERYVRMANLACVGSHSINGVAALHTELLGRNVLRDFHQIMPRKFNNKTNGVTPRRFMMLSNPRLSELITGAIGESWHSDLEELRLLEPLAGDAGFREEWRKVKAKNKDELASFILRRTGVQIDPRSLFDIHVKRIHEYKRQQLNVLNIVTLYNRLRRDRSAYCTPRTFIFGGKAAPSYFMAKLIIKLVNAVAAVVNEDPAVRDLIKVVFFPDFNVKNAQRIYRAADLSEQISTAGKEASGTGNMKFSLNGALTIGTLDGANVEMLEKIGAENFFLFGLTVDEVRSLRAEGYRPGLAYAADAELKEAVDLIASGFFSPQEPNLFKPLTNSLLHHDEYFVLADYPAYVRRQEEVGEAFRDVEKWTAMSILNAARMGKFSSDRTIREYCRDVWQLAPVPVDLIDTPPE